MNLINTNAVSYQLIKVGLEMLTKPKKPKRNGGKDKTEKAAGRWPRANSWLLGNARGATMHQRECKFTKGNTISH